jgi:N-methylhydantoinase A
MSKLGVDTGGTFTDFVWVDPAGQLHLHKQRSTPHNPAEAILAGITHHQLPPTMAVIHGSTVATNAILERRGAKTALITTRGFKDVLAIGRQNRPDLYALVPARPEPFVPSQWRLEVTERVTAAGEVLIPLALEELPHLAHFLQKEGIESVAVCLLFSFLHPAHEQQIRQEISPHFTGYWSLSSEILPEYREFERTSTTVLNAYVVPLMSRYLEKLAQEITPRPLAIMQSNGGLITAHTAGSQAGRTALSGPAGGLVGAQFVGEQAGFTHLITFDMGGTSTDVALISGRLPMTSAGAIAQMPLRLPMMDIHTVGAGGGSLAYVDVGGALQVGPESAGADPGPACYPALPNPRPTPVNSRATVTDANLVLGRLDPGRFLGGSMPLDPERAYQAVAEQAQQLKLSPEETAWGILQLANAHMERAIRKISVERGHDPRQFTLLPFGGAGPLHACELAEGLQIPRILVPPMPGVLSALGMLVASPAKDFSQTVMCLLNPADELFPTWLSAQFAPLESRAQEEMTAEGHNQVVLEKLADLRYKGQSHELTVVVQELTPAGLRAQFDQAHQQRYGYTQPHAQVELVTIRLKATSPTAPPTLPRYPLSQQGAEAAVVGQKMVWFEQKPQLTTLYDRAKLQYGQLFVGPAVVFQYDTTLVIPPGWQAEIDQFHNCLLSNM